MSDIGVRLRQHREEKKLTLRALAKLANVSHSFISDIEAGRSQPSIDTAKALAIALGISPSDLIENELTTQEKIEEALNENPMLLEFWREYSQREDLQLLFKQVKPLTTKSIKKIIEIIKLIEDEESMED